MTALSDSHVKPKNWSWKKPAVKRGANTEFTFSNKLSRCFRVYFCDSVRVYKYSGRKLLERTVFVREFNSTEAVNDEQKHVQEGKTAVGRYIKKSFQRWILNSRTFSVIHRGDYEWCFRSEARGTCLHQTNVFDNAFLQGHSHPKTKNSTWWSIKNRKFLGTVSESLVSN